MDTNADCGLQKLGNLERASYLLKLCSVDIKVSLFSLLLPFLLLISSQFILMIHTILIEWKKESKSIKQEGLSSGFVRPLAWLNIPGSLLALMWLIMWICICASHPSVLKGQGPFSFPEPPCIYWAKLWITQETASKLPPLLPPASCPFSLKLSSKSPVPLWQT